MYLYIAAKLTCALSGGWSFGGDLSYFLTVSTKIYLKTDSFQGFKSELMVKKT